MGVEPSGCYSFLHGCIFSRVFSMVVLIHGLGGDNNVVLHLDVASRFLDVMV